MLWWRTNGRWIREEPQFCLGGRAGSNDQSHSQIPAPARLSECTRFCFGCRKKPTNRNIQVFTKYPTFRHIKFLKYMSCVFKLSYILRERVNRLLLITLLGINHLWRLADSGLWIWPLTRSIFFRFSRHFLEVWAAYFKFFDFFGLDFSF